MSRGRRADAGPTILKRKALGRPAGNIGSETRERILQTAAAMFALQGLRSVSLNEIAGACGMSAAAIYNYFPSKDTLFNEVVCTMYEEIAAAFEAAIRPDEGLWDSVNRILDKCLEIYRDDAVLARLGQEAALEAVRAPDRFPRLPLVRGKVEAIFRDAVIRGVGRGELPGETDIDECGALVCNLVLSGIGSRSLAFPAETDFRRTVDAFRGLVRGLRGAAGTGPAVLSIVPPAGRQAG
jgi:AcrR family transcriptional regulator